MTDITYRGTPLGEVGEPLQPYQRDLLERLWVENHGQPATERAVAAFRMLEYTSETRRRKGIKPLTYAPCCDDPQPRIGEQSGRIFCASCRRYLDSQIERPAPQEDDDDEDQG